MLKINEKISRFLIILVVLQIFLLINTSLAEGYLLRESENLQEKTIVTDSSNKLIKSLLDKGVNLIIGFISIKQIGVVSAASTVCCEKVKTGGLCLNAEESECEGSPYSTSLNICEETGFCKPGWCFDSVSGYCAGGSPKAKCLDEKGEWYSLEPEKCQKGCCYLGINTQYTTEKTCKNLAGFSGITTPKWDPSITEQACAFYTEEMGACILDSSRACQFTTEKYCHETLNGLNFQKGIFCSDPGLRTGYIANYTKKCIDGKKDVYYFDNHNNPEGIATTCVERRQTCDESSGTAVCKSTICIDKNGKTRINGESWCEYDTYVGDGKDAPGSLHWLRSCENGQIKNIKGTALGDYRTEICQEKIVDGVSQAQYRKNLAPLCFLIDNKDECESSDGNPDCRWQTVNVDTYFNFGVCVPKYPEGFTDQAQAQKVCEFATQTCTRVEQKGWDFKWHCKANCNCANGDFVMQMNNLCTSLGDCGAYPNYAGNGTDNYNVQGPNADRTYAKWQNYTSDLAKPNIVGKNTPQYIPLPEEVGTYSDEFNLQGTTKPEYETINGFFQMMFSRHFDDMVSTVLIFSPLAPLALLTKLIKGIFGIGKTRKKDTIFTCQPWKPPIGGADCQKCNADPLKPCNEYRCTSLGTACGLLENTYSEENPVCYNKYSRDKDVPVISPDKIMSGYNFVLGTNGVSIKNSTGGCITRNSAISFSLKTNESAECRWSNSPISTFELMTETFKEGNKWSIAHSLENLPVYTLENNLKLYVRCIDHAGNWNRNEYVVDICISPEPDIRAPRIIKTEPQSNSYLKMGVTESPLKIVLNEAAECMYSDVPNTNYENMSGNMTCNNELGADETYRLEWSCITHLENLVSEINKIYIKCNDSVGNINRYDTEYVLYQTREELKIVSWSPENGSIRKNPVNKDNPLYLEVETEGGINAGKSDCEFKFLDKNWRDSFPETSSTNHRYALTSSNIPEGNYNVEIRCLDTIGNEAKTILNFTLEIDKKPPVIINVTNITRERDMDITLTSDEDAQCYYNNAMCIRDPTNQTPIDYGFSTTHEMPGISKRLDYFVTCVDQYNNTNGNCAIVINSTEKNDGNAPEAVRVYNDYGSLKLITNKEAKCSYDVASCNFNISNGISMTSDYSTEHEADWNLKRTYYIRCVDSWGNSNLGCLIIVKPAELLGVNL